MSGVSAVTGQLNATNACNNCNTDELVRRLQNVEAKNGFQDSELALLTQTGRSTKALADLVFELLGLKQDRGQLSDTDRIARQALALAQADYDAIFALDSSISRIESILPIISANADEAKRKADAAYALAQRAFNLADATATVTQIHTRQIDNLEIQVRSLDDRVSRLERSRADYDGLERRVGSLENWRTGTVAALILIELQLLRLRNRLDSLPTTRGERGLKGDKGDKGDRGLPGTRGDRGLKGDRGLPGAKGDRGEPGVKGDSGTVGTPGTNGTPGLAGRDGFSGSNGQPGRSGTNGTPGQSGTPGRNANPATNGTPGANGQPGQKGKDAQVELVNINAKKFDKCEDGTPKFTTMEVAVIKGTQLAESLKFEQLANVEGQQCTECSENVHGSPEWWEVRPGSNRPQLLLLFSPEGSNRANYQITIPHWSGEKPSPKNPPIKDYKKGSLMAVMHLADTSKLIVNAQSRSEAARVISKLSGGISYVRRVGSRTNYTELEGSGIREQTMNCRYAVYYPQGQKSKTPEWSVKFEIKKALLS
jgi:hypothetical protein